MHPNRIRLFRRAAVMICLCVLGCSNQHPELRRVSGTVTYNGEPVADAAVAFYNEQSSRLATGRTDEKGRFKLSSYTKDDGALPGEHRVVVTKVEAIEEQQRLSMDEAMAARRTQNRSRQLLPNKYTSPETTPLFVTVTEERPIDLAIELNDQ